MAGRLPETPEIYDREAVVARIFFHSLCSSDMTLVGVSAKGEPMRGLRECRSRDG